VFGGIGNGLKVVQVRLGPARLTHCMRWLGWSKRCVEIAQEYVGRREGFGVKLADRESVQMKLGEVGHNIHIGRLLTMHAAWKLDQGDYARKEVSMAKLHCANTLHQSADVAIQLKRSQNYQHLFDKQTLFVRAKLANGEWATPFDPKEMGHSKRWRDYTESNAWQTTFGVQHDVAGLIELFGGREQFVAKLDGLFSAPSTLPADAPPETQRGLRGVA